jgi:hypothetical protein
MIEELSMCDNIVGHQVGLCVIHMCFHLINITIEIANVIFLIRLSCVIIIIIYNTLHLDKIFPLEHFMQSDELFTYKQLGTFCYRKIIEFDGEVVFIALLSVEFFFLNCNFRFLIDRIHHSKKCKIHF